MSGMTPQVFSVKKILQCNKAPGRPSFGDCFLARSFGLVGRTAAAIQPRASMLCRSTRCFVTLYISGILTYTQES